MNEITITKDAASLLKAMHKVYKKRIRSGQPKMEAAVFGDPSNIRQEIGSKWSLEDINDACGELDTADLLNCLFGDDMLQMAILTHAGIAYAEGKAAGALRAVYTLIKEMLSFIPLML